METDIIRSDFDKLALWDSDSWDHNNHYHDHLLKQLPPTCEAVLEVGCGTGSFSRLLAQRANSVLALDLSPEMIKIARQRSQAYPIIEYQTVDVMQWDFPINRFNCIASIATLHHLPLEHILPKMKAGLKSGGVLVVLDLYESEGIRDWMRSLVAAPIHTLLKRKNTGRLREPEEVRQAWAEHGKRDRYLPVSKIYRICQEVIPGAVIKKHLLWRYSMVWKKPEI